MPATLQQLLAVSALLAICERLIRRDHVVTADEEIETRRLLAQVSRAFGLTHREILDA
jgi:hypothetical protein